ncbi:MAG: hypothetical protein HeimC3_31680 [Candidatus Heimdallarchaeota archaeon LC_3]|nr:MAG: hypothetical protein HeimC3_31680 [Candidatus Heimdallarchaeota archaeon LC_3]
MNLFFPWFTSHFLRTNYSELQKDFGGQTVTLNIQGYDRGKDLSKERVDAKISIQSSVDGFHLDIRNTNIYYFPTNDELMKFNENVGQAIKDLVNADMIYGFRNSKYSYFLSVLDTLPNPEIDRVLEQYIDNDLEKIFRYLLSRGSNKIFALLEENRDTNIFNNLTSDLNGVFDFYSPINQEFIDFLLEVFFETDNNNIGHFLQKTILYYPDLKESVKNILYNPEINLLDFYYGFLFNAIEDDLPDTLKDEVLKNIAIFEKEDLSQITNQRVKGYKNLYLEDFKTIQRKFLRKQPTAIEFLAHLHSFSSIEEQMKEIELQLRDKDYLEPITQFFKDILSNDTSSNIQKSVIYNFLSSRNFSNLDELQPVLKEQMNKDIHFPFMSLFEKLDLSKNELQIILNHPSIMARASAGRKLKMESKEMEKHLREYFDYGVLKLLYILEKIPFSMGHLLWDLRNLERINKLERSRFKEITPERKVIKLTFEEVKRLAISTLYHYQENVKEKNRENETEYFLLVEKNLEEPSTEERPSDADRMEILRQLRKSPYEHGRG